MEFFSGILGLGLILVSVIVSFFSGLDVPISSFKGQVVEIYPVARIVNYGSGGVWENEVNYLHLENDHSSHAGTVSKITKLTKFKVTRVRLSHSGFAITLKQMCYFTNVENSNEYFVDECGKIKAINQTTEYLIASQHYFEKNQAALVVAKSWHKTNAKKVFEVNRAAIFEVFAFGDFLNLQIQDAYRYEGVLYNRSYLMPYTFELKESVFYKFDYGDTTDDLKEYEEAKNFKRNVIPDNLLAWISKSYPNDLNTRWLLKLLYILSKAEYIPENYKHCFEKNLKIKDVGALIDKFNDETNANIKISNLHNSSCDFKKPTVLDDRFSIVSN